MSRRWHRLVTVSLLVSCGDNNGPSLNEYLPTIPAPTGGAQQAFAGQVTEASQLVTGPAQSGLVGDYFIKNDKVTFIVQAPTRVLGVIPQGGNVVDAVLTDAPSSSSRITSASSASCTGSAAPASRRS